mgnify:CR=1 FL=1|jgi:hypothetical protein
MSDPAFPVFPVIQPDPDAEAPSACTAGWVSNEELRYLEAMRELRGRGLELRHRIQSAGSTTRRQLEHELEQLRAEWQDLAAKRRTAERRKMASWGHIPWSEVEEG